MNGTDLAMESRGGFAKDNLRNLRTEIVLKDTNDVAFWFSFSFPLATLPEPIGGKRTLPVTHQTQVQPTTLFPKRRGFGETIRFGEDDEK